MWTRFTPRRRDWNLHIANPSPLLSASDVSKQAYELRLLNLLLPTLLEAPPEMVTKRESPDFEILTTRGPLFVESVDAIPDAIDATHTMNLARRRSRENLSPYHADRAQFAATIARVIEAKRQKARPWVSKEPELRGGLVLLVNGGQAPLWLRHYFRDVGAVQRHVPLTAIEPFIAVALGDETGAFLASDCAVDIPPAR